MQLSKRTQKDDVNKQWERHVQERSHPNHWFNRSSDLHASAGALWLSMSPSNNAAEALNLGRGFSMSVCLPVYHMLCGLALETVMKALLASDGRWDPSDSSHTLIDLAELLATPLTPDERRLLEFYSASITWAGRYPLPSRPSDQKLLDYWSLASSVLMVDTPIKISSTLKLRTASYATDWDNFHVLWHSYADQFRRD